MMKKSILTLAVAGAIGSPPMVFSYSGSMWGRRCDDFTDRLQTLQGNRTKSVQKAATG